MALRCLSSSIFRYRLVDQRVPAMCLSLAAARLRAELPSGKAWPAVVSTGDQRESFSAEVAGKSALRYKLRLFEATVTKMTRIVAIATALLIFVVTTNA